MIGVGGFGKVYRAKNKLDNLHYAIKKIRIDSKNRKDVSRLVQEVTFISTLNHKNIVRYYNVRFVFC